MWGSQESGKDQKGMLVIGHPRAQVTAGGKGVITR